MTGVMGAGRPRRFTSGVRARRRSTQRARLYRAFSGRVDHHASQISRICIGVLSASGVGGDPPSDKPSMDALTFAGNIAMKSKQRQIPAMLRVRGTRTPTAPAISRIPVIKMTTPGPGTQFGTILARSCRSGVKCAEAVKRSIIASAQRPESRQDARPRTPAAPIARSSSQEISRTARTITLAG